ncbi:hypothetical protein ACIGCZ_35675 [Streptomyces nigra]|uniref:hypothetical protein n=1 Tax=Streptomyces nigra TaxID=1827580 RepID=UPI0037CCEAC1
MTRDFDLTETAVRDRTRQTQVDAGGERDDLTNSERQELTALRSETRRPREDAGTACDGLLPDADPVNVDAFIEAEKTARHNVATASPPRPTRGHPT